MMEELNDLLLKDGMRWVQSKRRRKEKKESNKFRRKIE
jgi:hypothetical protein